MLCVPALLAGGYGIDEDGESQHVGSSSWRNVLTDEVTVHLAEGLCTEVVENFLRFLLHLFGYYFTSTMVYVGVVYL